MAVTLCALIAAFVILALFGDETRVAMWVRPLVPVLASFASAAFLFLKVHKSETRSTEQNSEIASTAVEAKQAVEDVQHQLNGSLDAKIKTNVLAALKDDQFKQSVRQAFQDQKGVDDHG